MKTCTRCNETKPLDDFHNCQSKPGGKFSACKSCRNQANRKRMEAIGYDKLYKKAKASPGYKEARAKRYQDNPMPAKSRARKWKAENPDRAKELRKADYWRNRQRYISEALKWSQENIERRREIAKRYSRKIHSDPKSRPAIAARKMLARVMASTGKKKKGKTFSILGYNKEQFKRHIESQFEQGMTWANHGAWHVDHIISVSEMIALGVTSPSKINALSNLRPIWAVHNLSKGSGFELVSRCKT